MEGMSGVQTGDNNTVRMMKSVKKEEENIGIDDVNVIIKHEEKKKPLLTDGQFNEFKSQVLIYKYIAAALPVPPPLLLPIWKSISSSFNSLCCADATLYAIYKYIVGYRKSTDQALEYGMDSELERCRRTDGKRWRCKKGAVIGQKYCERHMHRGRNRSRKLVESFHSSNPTQFNNSTNNSDSNVSCSRLVTLSNTAADIDLTISSSNVGSKMIAPTTTSTAKSRGIADSVNATATKLGSSVIMDSNFSNVIVRTNNSDGNESHQTNGFDHNSGNCSNNATLNNLIDKGSDRGQSIKNAMSGTYQGLALAFSPKSVLEGKACNTACFLRSHGELEPGRCRRTDGKKWQCRRDVMPDEKYCEMHMHRGAKRRMKTSQSPVRPNATPTAMLSHKEVDTDLHTNLSISISENHELSKSDDMNGSAISSSSDTILASC